MPEIFSIVAGLVFLALGGDALVRGSVRLAELAGVSRLLTGIVLVGFGTSTPELATSIDAVLRGSPGIAVGNVVGSNICNILLILGIAALIVPLHCNRRSFVRDGPVLVVATTAAIALALGGSFGRVAGGLFVTALLAYVTIIYRVERRIHDASAQMHEQETLLAEAPVLPIRARLQPLIALVLTLGGLGLVVWGADLMVTGSVELARTLGVSEAVIGLTIVAVGTSLPELATSIAATVRREPDIAVGNIMGSNIFNLLGILGLTALVLPIRIPPGMFDHDLWIMAAATLLFLLFGFGTHLTRLKGGIFLSGYILYLAFLAWRSFA